MTSRLKSGLEERLVAQLEKAGVDFEYERIRLKFTPPSKAKHKTFDFWITTRTGKLIIVEGKGWWQPKARLAELECIKQNPEYDIRYVFERASTKIRKGSKTSYADVCEANSILYAEREIPQEWLDE